MPEVPKQKLEIMSIFLASWMYFMVSIDNSSFFVKKIVHLMYNKKTEPCSAEAKCDFRSFRAVESFWTKQQSFISKKVGHQKWCLYFDFVCFSGFHFTKSVLFQK